MEHLLNALVQNYTFNSEVGLLDLCGLARVKFEITAKVVLKLQKEITEQEQRDALLKVSSPTAALVDLQNRLKVATSILEYRQQLVDQEQERKRIARRKEELLNLLAEKRRAADAALTEEQLLKQLEELN